MLVLELRSIHVLKFRDLRPMLRKVHSLSKNKLIKFIISSLFSLAEHNFRNIIIAHLTPKYFAG